MYPMQPWVDSIVDHLIQNLDMHYEVLKVDPAKVLVSAKYKAIRDRLCRIVNWDWISIFFFFTQLQDLPFKESHCCSNPECPGVVLDGTLGVQVKVNMFAFPDMPTSRSQPKFVHFQEHSCFKKQDLRDSLAQYEELVAFCGQFDCFEYILWV